ncbi:MAG TPA: PQQ-binding-like beta-propeller repeat protein [Acidimicrobiales bacterium]
MRRRSGAGARARLAAVALLVATAAGCWLQTGFGPARRAHNDLETEVTAATVGELVPRWTATVGERPLEPIVDRGRVFVPHDGGLTALALGSGTELWSGCCRGGPAIVDGQVRVTAPDVDGCRSWSIDPATGAATDRGPLGPPLQGFPGGCGTEALLAVGSRVVAPWTVLVGPAPGGSPGPCIRLQSWWLVGPGLTMVDDAAPGGGWEVDRTQGVCTFGDTPPPVPTFGPISSDGTSVLVPQGPTVEALPLDCPGGGCPVTWSVDLGAPVVGPPVVLAGGDVAVATADGHVAVVDAASHQVAWTADVGAPLDHPPAATPGTIVAAGTDGTVAAFPAAGCGAPTCAPAWTGTLPAPAGARPSIGGDVVYVGGADGTLTALPATGCGAATCAPLWTATTPAAITGAPVVTAGLVIVGSADGTVSAFGLPT